MDTREYDLLALGGGTAGLVSAAGASYLGLRAGLVDIVKASITGTITANLLMEPGSYTVAVGLLDPVTRQASYQTLPASTPRE